MTNSILFLYVSIGYFVRSIFSCIFVVLKYKILTMKKIFLLILLLVSILQVSARKREFRGAWIQCVNGQFQGMSTEAMQSNLLHQLDELQKDGVNAIIFRYVQSVMLFMRPSTNLGVDSLRVYRDKLLHHIGILFNGWWNSVTNEVWSFTLG